MTKADFSWLVLALDRLITSGDVPTKWVADTFRKVYDRCDDATQEQYGAALRFVEQEQKKAAMADAMDRMTRIIAANSDGLAAVLEG